MAANNDNDHTINNNNHIKVIEKDGVFNSYVEFEEALSKYNDEKYIVTWRNKAVKLINTEKLPVTEAEIENFRYKSMVYYCKFSGVPKGNRNTGIRETSSFKQGCPFYLSISFKKNKKASYLQITTLTEMHNHDLSAENYHSLSRQRTKAIKNSSEYLKMAMGTKSKMSLLQAQVSASQQNMISRQDLKNFKHKVLLPKDPYSSDLENLVTEMAKHKSCSAEIFADENNVLEGIYFQDDRMKKYFDAYPDLLFFYATYKLNDSRMPLVIGLVVDGNGVSQIVVLFIVKSENSATLEKMFQKFKEQNAKYTEVNLIVSDKSFASRKAFQQAFPGVNLHICIFHVAQIFLREITTRKRNCTHEQRKLATEILNKMIYAKTEEKYLCLYEQLTEINCREITEYFDQNWHNIETRKQWVECYTNKVYHYQNRTNNRLESLNQKLKSVLTKYGKLNRFFSDLMQTIFCLNLEKDFKTIKPKTTNAWDIEYKQLLTNFAYEAYFKDQSGYNSFEFSTLERNIAIIMNQNIVTRENTCNCTFYSVMGITCKHITKFRSFLELNPFDAGLVLKRWWKTNLPTSEVSFAYYSMDMENRLETTIRSNNSASIPRTTEKIMSQQQKYRAIASLFSEMTEALSEQPQNVFDTYMSGLKTSHL